MVQPVLDRHCVSCHGGAKGMEAGLDLTGGWTEHFNISYENLVSRRESQLEATLIAGIDCMNGTAFGSSKILPPRAHGSGAAPLARRLMNGHAGTELSRPERDLLMAWINLREPKLSRILRAPLAPGADGFGLGLCRDRRVDPKHQRIRQLVNNYAHAVKPVEEFVRRKPTPPDRSGDPGVSFPSTQSEQLEKSGE